MLPKEFLLYSDHEALKYLTTQQKLGARHEKWVEFLQTFQFVLKHKYRQLNKVTDALSKRHALLNAMKYVVVGLRLLKPFMKMFKACFSGPKTQFFIHDGYLFKGKQLCIPD